MEEKVEFKFKRTIFEKFPWLNLVLSILVTLMQITVAIVDFFKRSYGWTIIFILLALLYIFVEIPISYKIMKKTIKNNRDMKDIEKQVNEVIKTYKEGEKKDENISKL